MEPQMQMFNTKNRNKFYSWGREDKFFMLIVINIFFYYLSSIKSVSSHNKSQQEMPLFDLNET